MLPIMEACFAREDWIDLDGPEGGSAVDELTARLRGALTAERLVILAGLGTTMAIETADGRPGPPSMSDLWNDLEAVGGFETARALSAGAIEKRDVELLLSISQLHDAIESSPEIRAFLRGRERNRRSLPFCYERHGIAEP